MVSSITTPIALEGGRAQTLYGCTLQGGKAQTLYGCTLQKRQSRVQTLYGCALQGGKAQTLYGCTLQVKRSKGRPIDEIIAGMNMVAEGVKSAPTVIALAERHGLDMPIARDVYDVTGAGDALLAGFVHAHLRGASVGEAAAYGHIVAALTVASPHTVRPDLTPALVERAARGVPA